MEIVLLPTLLLTFKPPKTWIIKVKRGRYRQCDTVDKALPLQPQKTKQKTKLRLNTDPITN